MTSFSYITILDGCGIPPRDWDVDIDDGHMIAEFESEIRPERIQAELKKMGFTLIELVEWEAS